MGRVERVVSGVGDHTDREGGHGDRREDDAPMEIVLHGGFSLPRRKKLAQEYPRVVTVKTSGPAGVAGPARLRQTMTTRKGTFMGGN